MHKTCQRIVVTLGVVAAALGLTVAPAAAASTPVAVTWSGSNNASLSLSSSALTINPGDSVVVSYSSADPNTDLAIFTGGCPNGTPIGVANGGSATLTPSATTTYSLLAQDFTNGNASTCPSLVVTVSSAPPPDVPEVPFAAGLLGAAGVLFGAGFYLLRRRATRIAA